MRHRTRFIVETTTLASAAFFCIQLLAAGQGTNSSLTSGSTLAKPASMAAALLAAPNRIVISEADRSPRQVLITTGTSAAITWLVGQPATPDGKRVLPPNSIIINSDSESSVSAEPGKPVRLNLQVIAPNAHSGEYTGDVYLYTTNASAAVQVVVQIKDGPLWPCLVLAIGIGISFVLSLYLTSGRQYDDLVLRMARLERTIMGDPGFNIAQEYRESLLGGLQLAKGKMDDEKLADASAQLENLGKMMDNWFANRSVWIDLFSRLAALKKQAVGNTSALVQPALAAANTAAAAAASSSTSSLATALDQLASALTTAAVGAAPPAAPGNAPQSYIFTPEQVALSQWKRTTYLVASYLIVLGLFFIVGYQQLYDSKTAFGSNGIVDYFALFLWGFGVETATRASLTSVAKNLGVVGFA